MRPCHQTRQNRPRIAPSSGYAGIWSRPRIAPRGHQRPPERKILPETCSRLERSAGGLETLPEAFRERFYFVQNDNEKSLNRENLLGYPNLTGKKFEIRLKLGYPM